MALEYFTDALPRLLAALPDRWAHRTPTSELAILTGVVAGQLDAIAADIETVHADQALATATAEGLLEEWAVLYGAANEELPPTVEALRAYLQARAAEDGTIGSLEETLLALLRTAANDTGTELVFPGGGGGLTFPADGSGLPLFQATKERAYLRFAADGSGLTFPAGGAGLIFPTDWRVQIIESFSDYRLIVKVRDFLVFSRPAFARAVERFRPAHHLPPTITESPS